MTHELRSEEQFIYDGSSEISVGEQPEWIEKIISAFPAFQSKNYTLYFLGQLVSLIGTWLQIVAEGWLVLELTNSAFLVGVVAALATAPSLIFSLFGGVIVDRYPKKYILLVTQSSSMIIALVLGMLAVTHRINVIEIAFLAFTLGVVNAVDTPARQAFVTDLVNKEQLASAIALNSGTFNAARVIGPSIAGFLIAIVGTGGAYILNGLSYIAVIIALVIMHVPIIVNHKKIHPIKAIKEGVGYAFTHPIIRTLLLFVGIVSIFGWSYATMLSFIAKNVFHQDAAGLGYLYAASGLGALAATFAVSIYSKRVNALLFIIGGNSLFAVSLFLFTLVNHMVFALPFLFLCGFGLLCAFSVMNTTIQNMVENNMRGRVMSLYALMFLGLSPIGSFEIGFLTDHFGYGFAMRLGAVVVFLYGIFVYVNRKKIRHAQNVYNSENNIAND